MQQLLNRIKKATTITKSTGEVLYIDLAATRNPHRDKHTGKYISKAVIYIKAHN